MKRLIILIAAAFLTSPLTASEAAHGTSTHGEAEAPSPLNEEERALTFDPVFRKTDEHGTGYLEVAGEPLTVPRLLTLSPWDLMELVQTLAHTEVPLSRFGNGNGDERTEAWRLKVAAFAAADGGHHGIPQEDLFDPALVLWDPGYIQKKNQWGQWSIRIDRRDIVQDDLATLSPLEIQQAVVVLTGRMYSIEFVLDHLEAFRAQLSVVPRLIEAVAPGVHP